MSLARRIPVEELVWAPGTLPGSAPPRAEPAARPGLPGDAFRRPRETARAAGPVPPRPDVPRRFSRAAA